MKTIVSQEDLMKAIKQVKDELRSEMASIRRVNYDISQGGDVSNKADIDYVAMMTDVELPEEEQNES